MTKLQYNTISEEYSKMLGDVKKYILVPTFLKIVGKIKNKSVMDLGCGSGFFTRILAKLKPNKIIGVDISSKLIEIAISIENRDKFGIKYIVSDVLKLKINKTFDLITAVYLLNYNKDKKDLLKMWYLFSSLAQVC